MVVDDHKISSVSRLQRRRLFLVLVCAGLWTGLLIARLAHLQVVQHAYLVERAREPVPRRDIHSSARLWCPLIPAHGF